MWIRARKSTRGQQLRVVALVRPPRMMCVIRERTQKSINMFITHILSLALYAAMLYANMHRHRKQQHVRAALRVYSTYVYLLFACALHILCVSPWRRRLTHSRATSSAVKLERTSAGGFFKLVEWFCYVESEAKRIIWERISLGLDAIEKCSKNGDGVFNISPVAVSPFSHRLAVLCWFYWTRECGRSILDVLCYLCVCVYGCIVCMSLEYIYYTIVDMWGCG